MANHKSSTSGSQSAPGAAVAANPPPPGAPGGSSTGTASAGSGSTGATGAGSVTGVAVPGLSLAGVPSPKQKGLEKKVNQRLNGLEKYLPATSTLVINGQSFTVAQLVQVFTTVAGLYAALDGAVEQSKVTITAARQAINAELPGFEPLLVGLDNTLRGYFGRGNPVLANFGIATGARKKPSSATMAGAQATATLTRKARNTLGKKQRLRVSGGKATVQLLAPDGTPVEGSNPSSAPAPAQGGPAGNGANGGTK